MMGRGRDLTAEQRRTMISMRQAGVTVNRIAIQMNISRRTVSRVWRRFIQTGSCARRARSGRPKKTTLREDRMLKRVVQQQRFMSLGTVNRVWNDRIGKVVSQSTARRRIHSGSLYSRVARRKPLIGPNNRRARIRWCTRVTQWNTEDNWSRIVFSDESRFNLAFNDGRMRVWRENGTAMEPENIAGVTRRCSVSLMVWGCVSYHGVGELVIVDGTMKSTDYIDILDHNLLDSVENMFGDAMIPFIFQHDNAPVHTARNVQTWLDEHDVQVIQWPAQSPDLNVIENVWGMLQNRVMRDRPSTKLELIQCLFRAWGDITPDYLHKLFSSMPRRVRHVIRSRGYPTKY